MKELYIHIKEGSVTNRDALKRALQLPDGKYRLRINRAGKRSLAQNAYYHGVVVRMVKEGLKQLGHELDHEEVHHWLKGKFNYCEVVNTETGEYEKVPVSTTKLTKFLFAEYIGSIQKFAAEFLNIVIPDPGSQSEIWDVSYEASYDTETKSIIAK